MPRGATILVIMVKTLAELVKELRLRRGFSQRKLAQVSGVSRQYINLIESGKRHTKTSIPMITKLARGLDVPPETFLRAEHPPEPELPEQILERLRLAQPQSIPVYTEFPVHAGEGIEPVEYLYRTRAISTRKGIEAYIVHGTCLFPP